MVILYKTTKLFLWRLQLLGTVGNRPAQLREQPVQFFVFVSVFVDLCQVEDSGFARDRKPGSCDHDLTSTWPCSCPKR